MKNRICGVLMVVAGGCLSLAGCVASGNLTAGGVDTSGIRLGVTLDSDAKRAAFAAWFFDACLESKVDAQVCVDHLADSAKSHDGGPMVTAFETCIDRGGRPEECIAFAEKVQIPVAPNP